jgi:hypothetical protein
MAEVWLYYVPLIISGGPGKLGLSAKVVPLPHRLDSQEKVIALIDSLTDEFFPEGVPDLSEGMLPVTPLGWTLITAKRGAGVEPLKPTEPKH